MMIFFGWAAMASENEIELVHKLIDRLLLIMVLCIDKDWWWFIKVLWSKEKQKSEVGCGCVCLCKGIKKSITLRKIVTGASDFQSGLTVKSQVSSLTSRYCFKPRVYFYVLTLKTSGCALGLLLWKEKIREKISKIYLWPFFWLFYFIYFR